jgi:hypothetical protein
MIPTSQAKRFAAACWFVVCLAPMLARADDDPINIDRLRRPLSPVTEMRTPQFEVDVSEVPDDAYSADWAGQARVLCEDWFPLLCRYMAVEGWKPPEKIRLVVKKNMRAPALRTGSEIHISERWIRQHPDDLGMVIHELTHAIQDYPPGQPGWLVDRSSEGQVPRGLWYDGRVSRVDRGEARPANHPPARRRLACESLRRGPL